MEDSGRPGSLRDPAHSGFSLEAIRGDGPAAVHAGAQGRGGGCLGRAADQSARHIPHPQDPDRYLQRHGAGLPDSAGYETTEPR